MLEGAVSAAIGGVYKNGELFRRQGDACLGRCVDVRVAFAFDKDFSPHDSQACHKRSERGSDDATTINKNA